MGRGDDGFGSVANRIEWEVQGDKSGVAQPKGHGWDEGSPFNLNERYSHFLIGEENLLRFPTPWNRRSAPRGWACTRGNPLAGARLLSSISAGSRKSQGRRWVSIGG